VLTARLAGASRYLRIAGYFRASLLEVVGEALEQVGETGVVCNGDLDPHDVKVARAAREGQEALARTLVSSWQSTEDGLDLLLARERYRRLHDLLASGRVKVRASRATPTTCSCTARPARRVRWRGISCRRPGTVFGRRSTPAAHWLYVSDLRQQAK
jgi:hypothetical protein